MAAAPLSSLLGSCRTSLPPGYDVQLGWECMHWATGRSYKTPVGQAASPFLTHPDGTAMCELRQDLLLIAFRGTDISSLIELRTNVFGCGINPNDLFDDGELSCLPGEPRCHELYIVRSFEVLFTWLRVDIFGKYGPYAGRWQEVKRVAVTGHSMGGALAALFAYLLKMTNDRIRSLKDGSTMSIIGLARYLRNPKLRSSPALSITRRGDDFFDETTNEMISRQGLLLHPDCEIFVYAFSSTQVGNQPFKRMYEAAVPNTYQHGMYWDPLAPVVLPWLCKPGYHLYIEVRKKQWLFFLNFLVGGGKLHAPGPFLTRCFNVYFESAGGDREALWKLLEPHLSPDPLAAMIGDVGIRKSTWLTYPVEMDAVVRTNKEVQWKVMNKGNEDVSVDDLIFSWQDPELIGGSTFLFTCMVVVFGLPLFLGTFGLLTLLSCVILPLVLFPNVLQMFVVDQLFWSTGIYSYFSKRKAQRKLHRLGGTSPYEVHGGVAPDLEAPRAAPNDRPKAALPTPSYVNEQRQRNGYNPLP